MAIYRRGNVFWWKARLRFSFVPNQSIMFRLSLRTASPGEARSRGAELDLIRNALMEQLPILRRTVKPEDLPAIFRRAFERELDRVAIAQIREPVRINHRSLNSQFARYFTLLAEKPHLLDGSRESYEEFLDLGLSERNAAGLSNLAATYGHREPVSAGYVADDLRAVGIEPTQDNMSAAARVVAAAYREANIAACQELGKPIEPGEIWPLSAPLQKLAERVAQKHPQTGDPISNQRESAKPAPSPQTPCPPPSPSPQPPMPTSDAPLISELAKVALDKKIAVGAWNEERRRDVNAAVALFIAANGDVPVKEITQTHLIAMTDLFPQLPREYGRERNDENGNKVRETIAEAINRGAPLFAEWSKDHVAAEAKMLPYVGLSLVTQRKHLTWISSLITYVQGHMPNAAPTGLSFPAVRKTLVQPIVQGNRHSIKSGVKKNSNRLPWTSNELTRLFEAPVWQGCRSLWDKLVAGEQIYHDGDYFALPIIVATKARSNEICGLAVNDVFLDCKTPYIWLRPNALRRLKNDQSERRLPLPRLILNLGFGDYVLGMREAGHHALFPEYQHPTMDFETVFRKNLFDPLRAHCFPSGTSRKRGRKDVDVQSVRTFGMDETERHFEETKDPSFDERHRKGLGGHEQSGTASKVYEGDFEPHELLPQVEFLASFIPPIPKRQLNLRPPEFQKFGKPKGRPKKAR